MVWNRSLGSGSALEQWRRLRTLSLPSPGVTPTTPGVLGGFSWRSAGLIWVLESLHQLRATRPMCILEFGERPRQSLVPVFGAPGLGSRCPLRDPPGPHPRLAPPSPLSWLPVLSAALSRRPPRVQPGAVRCCSIPFVFFFPGPQPFVCRPASEGTSFRPLLSLILFCIVMVGRLVFACYCLTAKVAGVCVPLMDSSFYIVDITASRLWDH